MNSNLLNIIKEAEREALRGCGGSDILFESRVQAAYADILNRASEKDRAETEAALKKRGFDPNPPPYQAPEGKCELTGIDEDCCPCGRHE